MQEIIGTVAGIIVAGGTMTAGVVTAARWIWQRGYRAGRLEAELEALKKRMLGQ